MYHFKGAPPGLAPPFNQPRPNGFGGYPPSQPHGPPGQYTAFVAHQQPQQPQYGQYASTQQLQASNFHGSSQQYQHPGAYASNPQPHYHQQQQAQGSNQAHQAVDFPHGATYQSSYQACYNCGRSDHWAQNCPEPRRAVPAGALNGSAPLKRQKTTGPVVTRYPPPPNHSSSPSLQRGFTHPPAGHHSFFAPQGPPNSLSVNGQSYNSWTPQQNSFVSHIPKQLSQQWSPSVPTRMPSYKPQHASPVSMNGSAPYQHCSSAQSQPIVSQAPPSGNPIPLPSSLSVESSTHPNQLTNSSRRQSISSDRNQVSDAKVENVEPWLEELQGLDFTEGKVGSGPIISHPANPVAQPLAADCAAADAIGRLPIAASLPPGVSISMYFRNLDDREFERNVREKAEWNEVCNDPVFAEIISDCDAISVSELINGRHEELIVLDGSDDEGEGSHYDAHSRDQYSDDQQYTRERSYSDRSVTPFETKPLISRERSRTSFSGEQIHPRHSIEFEGADLIAGETQDQRLSREQEERLAALGVSGLPKPVQPSMRRTVAITQPPKAYPASPVGNADRQRRSNSPDKRATHIEYRTPPSSDGRNGASRDPSRELSHSEESPFQDDSGGRASPRRRFSHENPHHTNNGLESLSYYGSYDESHPAPPPQAPSGKHRYFDGPPGRHDSPTNVHVLDSVTSGHQKSPTHEDTKQFDDRRSPSRSRSDPHIGRKRSYRHSSEESDGGPKRQLEEHAQQHKRKHPKVAAAYSRRW